MKWFNFSSSTWPLRANTIGEWGACPARYLCASVITKCRQSLNLCWQLKQKNQIITRKCIFSACNLLWRNIHTIRTIFVCLSIWNCALFSRYLKEFRVEQCPLFLQHKCTQHRPFTCFHWHFMNQRRRRPIRRRDGTFNYSADNYCTKYDETTGICPDGDEWVTNLYLFWLTRDLSFRVALWVWQFLLRRIFNAFDICRTGNG